MLVFGVFSLYQLKNISLTLSDTLASNSKKLVHVVLMRDSIRQRQVILAEMLSMEDAFEREQSRNYFYKLSGVFREELAKLRKLPLDELEEKMLQNTLEHVTFAQGINREAVSILMEDHVSEKGRELSIHAHVLQKKIFLLLGELINLQDKNIQKSVDKSKDKYTTTLVLSIFFGVVIALMAWVIARIMTKVILSKNQELIEKNLQLEQASVLALEATRTKSEFLAIMSHEIRTPLTSIIGFAEALTERSTQIKDRVSITKIIIKNGNHLLSVINDILDLSKIEANKMDFEESYFSPVKLVTEIKELVESQFIEKNIGFHIEYQYPFPNIVYNDALRLKQILLNLCSNALKFTVAGEVSIKVHCEVESEKIFFTVIDSGIGLSKEQKDKIFEPFTQADTSTTRKYGGTGLGLSISKQFAEKMGGTITIESSEFSGSQFCLSISTGKIKQNQLILSEPELPDKIDNITYQYDYSSRVAGSILIVEDYEDNQQLLSILLSDIGADLYFVENGQEAVDKARIKNYDLILMDMQMPVMGGVEATKILRQSNYTGPIVALTANAMSSDNDICMEAGCNDFLTKPINKDKLFQSIYKYLEIKNEKDEETGVIISTVIDERNTKMRDLILRFVKSLPERIEFIKRMRKEENWTEMKAEVHKLKGIGTSMGYPMITEIAVELDYEVIRENIIEVDELLANLSNVCERVVKYIPDIMSENKE